MRHAFEGRDDTLLRLVQTRFLAQVILAGQHALIRIFEAGIRTLLTDVDAITCMEFRIETSSQGKEAITDKRGLLFFHGFTSIILGWFLK